LRIKDKTIAEAANEVAKKYKILAVTDEIC
jgi:hypothetical protein